MGAGFQPLAACQDPLVYLPRTSLQTFAKHGSIYTLEDPPQHLHLVITGRVKITRLGNGASSVLATIIYPNALFGEASLVGAEMLEESAFALDEVGVMAWTRDEIEERIESEPRLGLALAQYFVRRGLELQCRIESVALQRVRERVAIALLNLAADAGTPLADGAMRIQSLSQQTVAEYVGTSREVLSIHMNRLKRRGLLRYTRRYIDIFASAIGDELRARAAASLVRRSRSGSARDNWAT
jgi:CRP-like cAMP-binding protein